MISVRPPSGSPPDNNVSISAMPVGISSGVWRKRTESAAGMRAAREDSICCLSATAERMEFIRLVFAM